MVRHWIILPISGLLDLWQSNDMPGPNASESTLENKQKLFTHIQQGLSSTDNKLNTTQLSANCVMGYTAT